MILQNFRYNFFIYLFYQLVNFEIGSLIIDCKSILQNYYYFFQKKKKKENYSILRYENLFCSYDIFSFTKFYYRSKEYYEFKLFMIFFSISYLC